MRSRGTINGTTLTATGMAAVLACALPACDRADAPSFTTRDSAGISIVEYDALPTPPAWTLASEPAVAIGGLDADPNQELYEALHAIRLPDGRLAVANQGTEEIRFFGPDGRHLRTAGREGGGPGEFRDLWGLVRLPGDTLVAWDWTTKRLTLYDAAGDLARVVPAPDAKGFAPRLLGRLGDRRVAVSDGLQPDAIFAAGTGLWYDSVTVLSIDIDDGTIADTLGPFPGEERYASVGEGQFWARRLVFGRRDLLAVADGAIHQADDRAGELRAYDPTGRLMRIVRTGAMARPVTDAALDRFRADYLDGVAEERLAEERRRLDELPVADRLPAFDGIFADRTGRVWVRLFDPDRPDTRRWILFDDEGRASHHLDLPHRFQPLDAGEDWALFHARDDLDVERLVLFTAESA